MIGKTEPMIGTGWRSRRSRAHGFGRVAVDVVVGVVLATILVIEGSSAASIHHRVLTVVCGLVLAAAVAVRQRWPFGALLVGSGVVSLDALLGGVLAQQTLVSIPAAVLLFYAAGACLAPRQARFALVVGVAILLVQVVSTPDVASDLFFEPVILALAPWWAGSLLREREHRERDMRRLAEQIDANREIVATEAATEERAQLARELHDVIGHCLSVIVLQTGGARMLLDADRARAAVAMEVVGTSSHRALVELRRLLDINERLDQRDAYEPLPGMDDIEALVERTREAGLPTELCVTGTPAPLSPALALCAYRIVQEALTNAIKHAGPARAVVNVGWDPEKLIVEVHDDGRGTSRHGDPTTTGHGIIGMRERAALHGGTVETHAGNGLGFSVRALLPLRAAS
jgi:signal transduction histidine kinase